MAEAFELVDSKSLDPCLKKIGDRRIVMLGEASHGTHEYYTWRSAISKRLITEKGFRFIAVEGDWPDCYRINRFVKGYKDAGTDIREILNGFDRWPTWMWANWEVAALAEWLREYNLQLPAAQKIGFYGLDVYSLWDSLHAMLHYLEQEDNEAARSVKNVLSCFEPFNHDEHRYAKYSLNDHNCRDEVLRLLMEIRMKAQFLDGDREAGFNAEQNALIAVNAEKYYSTMMGFDNESWNIRDRHMMETLDRLLKFYGSESKAIVWEHNTHIGDARATDMSSSGMVNTGQLAREKYGQHNVYLIGFGSYAGTVVAGDYWGAPMKIMDVPEARAGSLEDILHHYKQGNYYFLLNGNETNLFSKRLKHRAIGVVYNPAREKYGNYVPTLLSLRYDAFIFIDHTKALHPLHMEPHTHKIPETWPFGL